MRTNRSKSLALAAAALLAVSPFAMAQNEGQGQGRATVTILPARAPAPLSEIAPKTVHVKVGGRDATITRWQAQRGGHVPVQLVLMIDNAARNLGPQMGDIRRFIQSLPPNVQFAIAYMNYGRAALAGPLTTDHEKTIKELHLPSGPVASNASPYFCLSSLAKHWPSSDQKAIREVIMITDGVDYYDLRYDPNDPYMQSSISDSIRHHIVVYSIYWRGLGEAAESWYENNAGQNLLSQVTSATGGYSWWIGIGNPVAFAPYFHEFETRLRHQYELGFTVPFRGKARIENLRIKVAAPDTKLTVPSLAYVTPAGAHAK